MPFNPPAPLLAKTLNPYDSFKGDGVMSCEQLRQADTPPTLLVIDDELGPRESLRFLFKDDYHVMCADTVDRGLQLMQEKSPDTVIMDIRMPVRSGIDGLREIRRLDSDLAVIHKPAGIITIPPPSSEHLAIALLIGSVFKVCPSGIAPKSLILKDLSRNTGALISPISKGRFEVYFFISSL